MTKTDISKCLYYLLKQTKRSLLKVQLGLTLAVITLLCTGAYAAPMKGQPLTGKSKLMNSSSKLTVGKTIPFFSGWLSNGHSTFSTTKLLKKRKKRYVVTVCNSKCIPCFSGLRALSEAQDQFKERDISLVIYAADDLVEAQKIKKEFNFTWAQVVADKFGSFAKKLASDKAGILELPRTFVFNAQGKVELIIGEEGEDFISLLLNGAPQ
jgi:peroxiredoxin